MLQTPQPERLLAWISSLADGTRLRLLRLLERNELGVVELCDVLQLPQSTVSRHLLAGRSLSAAKTPLEGIGVGFRGGCWFLWCGFRL